MVIKRNSSTVDDVIFLKVSWIKAVTLMCQPMIGLIGPSLNKLEIRESNLFPLFRGSSHGLGRACLLRRFRAAAAAAASAAAAACVLYTQSPLEL